MNKNTNKGVIPITILKGDVVVAMGNKLGHYLKASRYNITMPS
ncbi:hypothetical protein [Clostridium sp.]|nr:hypothetical protein [Clostridium sp.]MDR3598709.1 hypothetical protein [Clostridium sp.]